MGPFMRMKGDILSLEKNNGERHALQKVTTIFRAGGGLPFIIDGDAR